MMIIQPDPVLYTTALSSTVFYRHPRGVLRGTGADRLDLLHRLSTNGLIDLRQGQERTTILTTEKGRIIEVVRVVVMDDAILMVLSSTEEERVRRWLDKYTIMDDFVCTDVTPAWRVIGVYGEGAREGLRTILDCDPPDSGSYVRFSSGVSEGILMRDVRLHGGAGFLFVVPVDDEAVVIERLVGAGLHEIDRSCYDVLRLEAGIPSMEAELDDRYNPLEAGMSQHISWTKGCYIGQKVIARLDTYDKVQRHLVGVAFDHPPSTDDDPVVCGVGADNGSEVIGSVTSLAFSPGMRRVIGLAYIKTAHAVPGLEVVVGEGRGVIVKLPFER